MCLHILCRTARARPAQMHLQACPPLRVPQDRDAVVQRAQQAGCKALVITGSCVRTATTAARYADKAAPGDGLFFTAGVHPHNAKVGASGTAALAYCITLLTGKVAVRCGAHFIPVRLGLPSPCSTAAPPR